MSGARRRTSPPLAPIEIQLTKANRPSALASVRKLLTGPSPLGSLKSIFQWPLESVGCFERLSPKLFKFGDARLFAGQFLNQFSYPVVMKIHPMDKEKQFPEVK